jgi:GNAT superfamily N-acetyltransferase
MARPGAGRAPLHTEFTLRSATEADLEVLADQRLSMWREMTPDFVFDYSGFKRNFRAWARRMMRRKKLFPFLVTDPKGLPVAGGSIWIREYQPSPRYKGTEQPYLMSMYTDPRYRGKGLATMIVKHAIKWSSERGYPRLSLHASDMGEPVYAKQGFKRTTEMRYVLNPSPPKEKETSRVRKRRQS